MASLPNNVWKIKIDNLKIALLARMNVLVVRLFCFYWQKTGYSLNESGLRGLKKLLK